MRDGFYRLQYETGAVTGSGVMAFHEGVLSGCSPYYFMHGTFKKKGNSLEGIIEFERHTERPNQDPSVPREFTIRISGLCGANYGQFVFSSPDGPHLKGSAKFTWLGAYQ
ncbi:hypothetical protein FHS83_002724 [Rhizomicrobium palustre]|uniref:T3SS negative regulator,GrlR n=1 Tax=Rhizomicrobium palustre TaxID=189966 RepID=A0A846N117_9PROT|nr:hypothetical protein [Rhizomicrobium palustre]NIK89406.1 hypothetical protein [Rhizomicrobium palustre]